MSSRGQPHPSAVDEDAFERLVARHAQDVYAFLLYRTGDHWLAEDVLADTLERAYRARARYDRRRGSERTWLVGIALNRLRDIARRAAGERRTVERLAAAHADSDDLAVVDVRRDVLAALDDLPSEEREVVALVYGGDLTAKQVARLLEQPLTTVHGRLYRGLRRMRVTLEDGERAASSA